MIKNYFKTAWRNLVKNKIYSFINIFGLSVGLASTILIFLYTKDEVSYDRFHTNHSNIYRIVNRWTNPDGSLLRGDGNTGDLQGPVFKEKIPEIKDFVRYQSDYRDIRASGEIKTYEVINVDSNFFSFFTFPFLSGNSSAALLKPNSVVISEEMAEKFFNSLDVLGKTLEIKSDDKFEPYEITAISRKCPQNSSIKFDLLLKKKVNASDYSNKENWFSFFQNTFVSLHLGANPRKVEEKMKLVYEAEAGEIVKSFLDKYNIKEKAEYKLQAFADMHLSTDFTAQNGLVDSSNPTYSYILSGIALFILVIACINFVNLTIARSLKRWKEIGVRKAVGGSRRQLMFQFLGEAFFISFIAFIMALFWVQMILPVFNQLANKELSISYLFDAKLILGYITIFIITSLLAGFYPAIVLSGYDPANTLYGKLRFSGKNYLQKVLVVLQFGLASFLIIATMSIYSQFDFLIRKDLGYDDTNILMVENPNMTNQKAEVFKNELLKNANILSVAPKNGGNWGTIAKVNGEKQIEFTYETIDEKFIPLLKVPLVSGRNFSSENPFDATRTVIVNEAFVKEVGWNEPLGEEVNFFFNKNEKYQVIGVVKDYHFRSLTQKIGPQLFAMKPDGFGMMYIKIRPGTETHCLAYIEKVFKKLFPINPFVYKFKETENQRQYQSEAKWKKIILFGAVLTIFISCIGLFGLAALSAEKRNKEIGIRKVLGASVQNIATLLSKDFILLVCVAFVFAFPAAYFVISKWLENYPYRISLEPSYFLLTAVITASIALFTVSFQSVKAAIANPVKSLRTE